MGCVLVSKCYLESGGIRVYLRWMELVLKCGCAEAFCSALHLCDETQGSEGPSVSMSLHFQPAERRSGFINKAFMEPVVYYLVVKVLQKGLPSCFSLRGVIFK